MFPIEFNHTLLDSLPLVNDDDTKRVSQILKAILIKRVIPYFKKNRGADPIIIAQTLEKLSIERLEDEANKIRVVSLVINRPPYHIIYFHERIFDYISFVVPTNADARLGEGGIEEQKMLAFAELILKHQFEQILYPHKTTRELIHSDISFSNLRRNTDPTFHIILKKVLDDELNGINGECYLTLFNKAGKGSNVSDAITRITASYVDALGDVPEDLLQLVFPLLDTELQTKTLGACFRKTGDTGYSLLTRTLFLHKLLRLFQTLTEGDQTQAEAVFEAFKNRWGLLQLFRELDIPETSVEGKTSKQIFELLKESLMLAKNTYSAHKEATPIRIDKPKISNAGGKTLRERIEEARENPAVPRSAIEIIDKNKLNAMGQSGSKYSELIETLLAIPWGIIKKIDVTAAEFEQGLNLSHHGLVKQKEITSDFFSNLIWRYTDFDSDDTPEWSKTGSAFLFVGPPGVGKTSLAISIAKNLGIPYHKLSLGGMRDEADLRGHGFSYEGSKPGAIVQGLIKMGTMNGMFIMDEADKTEKFAIATLLEILDPEQNHLFHDKYIQTAVDIDLSNAHFILTANTLETVPPPVINRCEVVFLDRYSLDEKVTIARQYLVNRVRQRHQISEDQIVLYPGYENDILKYLIKNYTHEAGVRELERIIRTLFLRAMRKEVMVSGQRSVIDLAKAREYIGKTRPSKAINETDGIGEMLALGVNTEYGVGSLIPIQATSVHLSNGESKIGFLSSIHATGNIEKVMDESRKVAMTAILHSAEMLGINLEKFDSPIHLHFMGGATPKDGPSAGSAIALALASVLTGLPIRRDLAMTGEIDTQGRISMIGGLDIKLETAVDAGCKTIIIPNENLREINNDKSSVIVKNNRLQMLTYEEWKNGAMAFKNDKYSAQIIGVNHILQAVEIAFIYPEELLSIEETLIPHAHFVLSAVSVDPTPKAINVWYMDEIPANDPAAAKWNSLNQIFLIKSDIMSEFLDKYPEFKSRNDVFRFDPEIQGVGAILEAVEVMYSDLMPESEIFVYGPHEAMVIPAPDAGTNINFFSLDSSVQGIDLSPASEAMVSVYRYLSLLGHDQLESCPFIGEAGGIKAPDLEFIHEKYRLDAKRAADIFSGAIQRWLKVLDEQEAENAGAPTFRIVKDESNTKIHA